MKRDGLWLLGSIVDEHEDVFMAPDRLRQWPYGIHAHLLEGDPDYGQRD